MDRNEALNTHLLKLRQDAGLSLEQVCQRTKIQTRYVTALEEGRFGELPSNTHLRAFSLALAQACNGDVERTAMLVRRVLEASGAVPAEAPVPPLEKPEPLSVAKVPVAMSAPVRPRPTPPPAAVSMAAVAVAEERRGDSVLEAADGIVLGASQRLKALPWQAMLGLALTAALLSGALLWGFRRWQAPPVEAQVVPTEAPATEAKNVPAPKSAAAAPVVAEAETVPRPVATTPLVLRARRPCWLVLKIDGERLATITMAEGEKRSWPVEKKAVLLAGNVGALRVWWRGDNLGYLGELGSRQNGMLFETDKAYRVDHGNDLVLPAGVPE